MFMDVSIELVAAISQSSSPLKALSIGTMLSTAGNSWITFSAVMPDKVRSKPALRSFLVRVE